MLRKFLLTGALFALLHLPGAAQQFSLSIYAGAGGNNFEGSGTATHTNIPQGPPYYNKVDNPYGKWGPTSWFAGVNAQWRLKNNWLLSVSPQYEYFGSQVSFGTLMLQPGSQDTMGFYKKEFYYLSINPEVGRMILDRKISVQVNAGIDYAFYIYGEDEAIFNKPGISSSYGYASTPGKDDFRLTAGAYFTWRKWKLGFTYKHGLSDYRKDNKGEVYSRLLHWKLMYRLFQKPKNAGRK